MSKAEELLEKIDIEVEAKMTAAITENADRVEAEARAVYEAKKKELEADICKEVAKPYEKAKEYLLQVVEAEKVKEAEQPVQEVTSEVI